MMEGTGFDRPSILSALCVIALSQGGAQQPAVRRVLDRQGWAQQSRSGSPNEGAGGFGGKLQLSGEDEEERTQQMQRRTQVLVEEKLVKAERCLEAIERAEAHRDVRTLCWLCI